MKQLSVFRVLALLLAICLLLAMGGCGQTVEPAETAKPGAASESEKPSEEPAASSDPTASADATPDGMPTPAATAPPSGLYVKTTGEGGRPDAEDGGSDAEGEYGGMLMEAPYASAAMPERAPSASAAGKGGETGAGSAPYAEGGDEEPAAPPDGEDPVIDDPVVYDPGEPFVLTAAEWNDNDNWPFFTNLVNAGTIDFPSYGVDPRNRLKVTLLDADGAPLAGEAVELLDAAGRSLWTAQTDKDGNAYLFWQEGETPASVPAGDAIYPVTLRTQPGEDQQGDPVVVGAEDLVIHAEAAAPEQTMLQVMFIVDTTGSMSDELGYLQKDFSAIAGEFDGQGIEWSACFYRDEGDEYVTRASEFTADVAAVQELIGSEYATGGGDTPEAVAEILDETLRMDFLRDEGRSGWREDAVKLAFLIFDAPPHYGKEDVLDAAVRRAAEAGIRLIPVVASNAERDTELFARAIAICTGGTYVFLTDDSGVGYSHLEPIVGAYTVEKLHDLIVRILTERMP